MPAGAAIYCPIPLYALQRELSGVRLSSRDVVANFVACYRAEGFSVYDAANRTSGNLDLSNAEVACPYIETFY